MGLERRIHELECLLDVTRNLVNAAITFSNADEFTLDNLEALDAAVYEYQTYVAVNHKGRK